MTLLPNKCLALEEDMAPGDVKFKSTNLIIKINSKFCNLKLLMQIYNTL